MRKFLSFCMIVSLAYMSIPQDLESSVIRGKRYYIQLLKRPCGFNGDVMGSKHTTMEWRDFYKNGTLSLAIKEICPKAPEKISKRKIKHIYHFLSSFASDSGNVPSCN